MNPDKTSLASNLPGLGALLLVVLLGSLLPAGPGLADTTGNSRLLPLLQGQGSPRGSGAAMMKNKPHPQRVPDVSIDAAARELQSNLHKLLFAGKSRPTPPGAALITERQGQALARFNEAGSDGEGAQVRFSHRNGTPTFIKPGHGKVFRPAATIAALGPVSRQTVAMDFLQRHRALLKLERPEQELQLHSERTDAKQLSHLRFNQTINGIPVWGRQLIVHMTADNGIYLLQGRYLPTPVGLDDRALIDSEAAVGAVLQHLQLPAPAAGAVDTQRVYYVFADDTLLLTWKVNIRPALDQNWTYFVNASSGQVAHRIDNIHRATVNATGTDVHGTLQTFRVWSNDQIPATYYLIDPDTPVAGGSLNPVTDGPLSFGDTYIMNANNSFTVDAPSYITSNNAAIWKDATAVSAAVHTRWVYSYYADNFARNSIDDAGMNLMTYIHFGSSLDNAFWNGSAMIYGDGGSIFSPLAGCYDVTVHEMTHGVIQTSAGLIYEYQSGALNESFADVFAAFADVDNDPWVIAEQCTEPPHTHIRSLVDPADGLLAQPAHMDQYQNLSLAEDSGGVHINSGIPNRAAYLIAQDIGVPAAEQIYYRALTTYLTPFSQFVDARTALIQAADDLHGAGSVQSLAVAAAFDAVGIIDGLVTDNPASLSPSTTDPLVGEDVMVYLAPVDGTNDSPFDTFRLYTQTMDAPFAGHNPANTTGPWNAAASGDPVAYRSKPSAFTDATGTYYFYIGVDFNIYQAVLGGPDIRVSNSGVYFSFGVSPDGRYAAFTTIAAGDNNIYVVDFENNGQVTPYPIIPPSYSDGPGYNTVYYADVVSFDHTGDYIAFDALHCLSLPGSQCNEGNGYQYWSVGVLDLGSGRFYFPFPSQNPDLSIGNPVFAANSNHIIAMDSVDTSDVLTTGFYHSEVIALDYIQNTISSLYAFADDPDMRLGVPSFWGNDDFVNLQHPASASQTGVISASRRAVDASWTGTGSLEDVHATAVAQPLMHRRGYRNLHGPLTADAKVLTFGTFQNVGDSQTKTLTITNTSSADVNITGITSSHADFTHTGIPGPLARGASVSFDVTYTSTRTGTLSASLTITHDGTGDSTIVPLVGSTASKKKLRGGCSLGNGSDPDYGLLLLLIIALAGVLAGGGRHRRQC